MDKLSKKKHSTLYYIKKYRYPIAITLGLALLRQNTQLHKENLELAKSLAESNKLMNQAVQQMGYMLDDTGPFDQYFGRNRNSRAS